MGRAPLRAAAAAFLIFIANVTLGAFAGAPFLGDVAEMLMLLLAVTLFVAGILIAETAEKTKNNAN
jgi:hypothetical protein